MITYGALVLVVIVTLVFYFLNPKKILWWEFFGGIVVTLLIIFGLKALISHENMQFNEFRGETITTVFEEEPYNYWHHKRCHYTTCVGSGKNRHCTTHYYDCSHQDNVGPSWHCITNLENKFSISERQHDSIIKLFSTPRKITKERRNYDAGDKCVSSQGTKFAGKRVGKISRVLSCSWNGKDETRKGAFTMHSYENRIKASDLSLFNIKVIEDEEADSLGLFKYPDVKDHLEYPTILGKNISEKSQELFRKLNAKFGPQNKLRLWVLVFDNKPVSIAVLQENYWVKGNQNELVICIGRKGQEIQWVHSFSWSLSGELTAKATQTALSLYTFKIETNTGKNTTIAVPLEQIKPIISKNVLPKEFKSKLQSNIKDPALLDTTVLKMVLPVHLDVKSVTKMTKSNTPVLTDETWEAYYNYLNNNLKSFQKRSFKEFNYLTVELKTWQIILVYVLALGISIGINIWATNNEFEE